MPEHVVRISHLRDCLGVTCQYVAHTNEPVIVQRYSRQDVVIVPLWEWRFLKEIEAEIQAGRCPWEEAEIPAQTPTLAPCGEVSGNPAQDTTR